MGKMDRIGAAVRDTTATIPNIEELLNKPESAMNLSVIAEEGLNELVASGANPARIEAIRSLTLKLNETANRPENSKVPIPTYSLAERQLLMPIMGRYKQGAEAVRAGEKVMSDQDIETVVRVMALHPEQSELAGILALNDGEARDRVARGLKLYAYKRPEEYTALLNNLTGARNFVRADWGVLSPIFAKMEQFGVDKATVMRALDNNDWRDQLTAAVEARMQGKDSGLGIRNWLTRNRIEDFRGWWTKEALIAWTPYVNEYRGRARERLQYTAEIDNAFQKIFFEEGIAGKILTQEALQPDAPPESQRAYDALQVARTEMSTLMENQAAVEQSLRSRLQSDPLWADRADPAVSEQLASRWLDEGYREQISAASEGGAVGSFWSGLWNLLSSLFGTAYSGAEVNKVANRIRGL